MNTRVISFGGSAVRINATDPACARIVDFLFGLIELNSDISPHLWFNLEQQHDGQVKILCSDPSEDRLASASQAAQYLMERVCYHLADRASAGVMLHAACLSLNGKAFVLPGTSGSGKSTLSAWLARQGFTYASDELVHIPHLAETVQGFPRPLHIKSTAATLFPDFEDEVLIRMESFGNLPAAFLLLPRAINPQIVTGMQSLHAFIFPHYEVGAAYSFQLLSKAETSLRLTGCLINARNLPDHGFPEIVRLSRAVPGYSLTYSSFEQIGDSLHRLS